MFPYDPALLAAVQPTPATIADVIRIQEAIDGLCAEGDGLKWFNGLYLEVTRAVQARAGSRGQDAFAGPAFMAALDVEFARFYFDALRARLAGQPTPGCWQAVFDRRDQAAIARIQFALAGMNAHINHDLAQAVANTCREAGIAPQHGTIQYEDFTALNTTLDSLIEAAKLALNVRLPGDALPPVTNLEDTLAAWSMTAAREAAWNNGELIAHLHGEPLLLAGLLNTLDGMTELASTTLLVPVP